MLASNVAAFSLVQPCSRLHYSRLAATEEEIAWMLDDDAWDEEDDEDDESFDEQMRVRAAAEHESYASRTTPLAPATDAVDAVRTRGVALIEDALPDASLREILRSRILERRDAGAGLSSVLGERCDDGATTRFDIRLPYDDVVSKATSSLLRRGGPLADALDALVGPDAPLWECAALVSEAGAPAQTVHGDTFWDAEPCLYTAFVALQDVDVELGPTLFFPRSHLSATAQDDLEDDGPSALDGFDAEVGVMRAGACTLYDGRLLHAGQPNSKGTRVLFYVSFKAPGADGGLGNEAAHSIDADLFGRGLTLGDLLA
jgi:hypothetical protein